MAALGVALAPAVPMHGQGQTAWTISWASSQLQPYGTEVLPSGTLEGSTLRQVVHLSLGGTKVRIRLANTFGNKPLKLSAVHVALRSAQTTQPGVMTAAGSDRSVTFNHEIALTLPTGTEYLSDSIDLPVAALSDLVVTMLIDAAPDSTTFHAGAHATSFLKSGDHVSEPSFAATQTFTRWYFLSGVEVTGTRTAGAVVALGDSITDGHGSTTDANDRWPDVLARRLSASGKRAVAVVNEGIGGNRILQDGLGPSALARFDRDVLSQPGARYLIVLEGINDLGGLDRTEEHPQAAHDALLGELELAMTEMAARAHEHGLRVYGATLSPYLGSDYYHPSARSEADRQAFNSWIRTTPAFDSVIDFDAALRDPANAGHMLPAYDSGDHLHPGPAGYKRMGELVPEALFNY